MKWESQYPFHAIFGYLEVGEIIGADRISKKEKFDIYEHHPHFANACIYKGLNSVYVASDNLKGTSLKGSGTIADAILDRTIYSSHRIELGGESMRKNNRLEKLK